MTGRAEQWLMNKRTPELADVYKQAREDGASVDQAIDVVLQVLAEMGT